MKTIWTGKNAKVKQDEKGGLRFWYRCEHHASVPSCEWSLFSEVGQMYRCLFDEFFATRALARDYVDYGNVKPYIADRLA